jgi:hypothetical protein
VSYPQQGGYPQQPYSGGGYPAEQGGGTNPATAIIAALLALAVTAFEIVFLVRFFDALGGASFGDIPGKVWAVIGSDGLAGLLLLLGAMFAFGRKMAGSALIIIGSLVAIVGFFLYPLMVLGSASVIGKYLQLVFQFGTSEAIFQALTLIGAPLALIFAAIPPTTRHLRGSSSGSYEYQNAGGYQQQPYNNAPNSGGFPQQQDYPGYQPQQGQGGYPQQQPGGYPNQQQQGWQ